MFDDFPRLLAGHGGAGCLVPLASPSHHYVQSSTTCLAIVMSNTNTTTTLLMTPYLHFTSGDALFFKSWTPSSAGAIAGASIGVLVLAILERWLSAVRGVLEEHWRRRYGGKSTIEF